MDLILKTINNLPKFRARASEIVERLAEMVLQFPASFANQLEMLRRIKAVEDENKSMAMGINLLKEEHSSIVEKLRSQLLTLNVHDPIVQNIEKATHLGAETQLGKLFKVVAVYMYNDGRTPVHANLCSRYIFVLQLVLMALSASIFKTHNVMYVHIVLYMMVIPHAGLRGVEVCSETTVLVTNNPQTLYSGKPTV